MIRERQITDKVVVCDDCKEPKQEYHIDALHNCYVCNKDLCTSHIRKLGNYIMCRKCHKSVMMFFSYNKAWCKAIVEDDKRRKSENTMGCNENE